MKQLAPALLGLTMTTAFQQSVAAQPNGQGTQVAGSWKVDFFDDFDSFNPANWQDQQIWVNEEKHCYVPDGKFGTREVSDGTLKIRLINLGEKYTCTMLSKSGEVRPPVEYVSGRIISKNRQEFIKGKWTARLRVPDNGQPGMFPAWWLLGAQNNEPPVDEPDENVCWPMTGSGEIDIFEHTGSHGPDQFTTGAILSEGNCDGGDWRTLRVDRPVTLSEFHEYSVEWQGSDLVYRVDGEEVQRNVGQGDNYPEPMFALLNFAKISDPPMEGTWVMEVDWVKHEYWED
jgi:beta-glucanase (GH16 family)